MREIFELTFVELDWISYMPLATVQGEVIYEGRKIPVDGLGYHDHNWYEKGEERRGKRGKRGREK